MLAVEKLTVPHFSGLPCTVIFPVTEYRGPLARSMLYCDKSVSWNLVRTQQACLGEVRVMELVAVM